MDEQAVFGLLNHASRACRASADSVPSGDVCARALFKQKEIPRTTSPIDNHAVNRFMLDHLSVLAVLDGQEF